MKDYVFIGWSRNRELAIEVKKALDAKGFVCVIGGQYDGNPEDLRTCRVTVNETVTYQMNHCDQAILLFQKIDDNLAISGNLIYELGYITAQYNFIDSKEKLHIFKIDIGQADDNLFPSDLHGVWGTNITSVSKSLQELAGEIAEEFLRKQNQIQKKDKFALLNDHHFVAYESPSMSDYDLAIHILIYMQSAFCYQQQNDIFLRMEHFKSKMIEKRVNSKELGLAVDYALLTLKLFCLTIPSEEDMHLRMEGVTFRRLLRDYNRLGERIAELYGEKLGAKEFVNLEITKEFYEENEFESLLIGQMQEHITYLVLVYIYNTELSVDEAKRYSEMGVQYCNISIKNLELLAQYEENKRFVWMLLGYAYKNLSTFAGHLERAEIGAEARGKSLRLRRDLHLYANNLSFVKPSLRDYTTLEYLLQVVEEIEFCEDEYEVLDYLEDIREYIEKREKTERNKRFMLNMLIEGYEKVKEQV